MGNREAGSSEKGPDMSQSKTPVDDFLMMIAMCVDSMPVESTAGALRLVAEELTRLRSVLTAAQRGEGMYKALYEAAVADTSAAIAQAEREKGEAVLQMQGVIVQKKAAESRCAEWKALADAAIAVLQRHIPPDGISDHEALNELYGIFDGSAYRAALAKEAKNE